MLITLHIDPIQASGEVGVFAVMDKDYADYITGAEVIDALDGFSNKMVDLIFTKMKEQHPNLEIKSHEFAEKSREIMMAHIFPPSDKTIIKTKP